MLLPKREGKDEDILYFHTKNKQPLSKNKIKKSFNFNPPPKKTPKLLAAHCPHPSLAFLSHHENKCIQLTVQIQSCRHSIYRTFWKYFKHKKYTW